MSDLQSVENSTTIQCENCSAPSEAAQKYCTSCGFPVLGSPDEKGKFRIAVSNRKRFLKEAQEKTKTAKIIIYVLAGLFLLTGLYEGFANDDFATMIVDLLVSLLYLILAAWSDKNSFGAILTAFIVFLTLHVVNAFVNPASIFQGLFLKIFFIGAFVKGIRSATEAQQHLKELEKAKAVPGGDN